MNDIITGRTNPIVRFKLQGVFLCEKLNKHLLWKQKANILYKIILFILGIIKPYAPIYSQAPKWDVQGMRRTASI